MQRDQSLDALRGFAILAMVLSGSIAYGGVLPAWMYHAQVPPPLHKFLPTLPGISWVDLVFPFFLFSMGAAIPLSLSKLEKEGAPFYKVLWIAARRFVALAFFALFTQHMKAWVLAAQPGVKEHLLSLLAFALLFFGLYDYKGEKRRTLFAAAKTVSFAAAVALLWTLPTADGDGFKTTRVDIIILVLANMAFFGTVIWWLTRESPALRIGLLAFVMAVFLASKTPGSWTETFYNWSPVQWLYKFYYLKYLFIISPGTVAGEWMKSWSDGSNRSYKSADVGGGEVIKPNAASSSWLLLAALAFGIVWCNTALLFSRLLVLNLALSVGLLLLIYFLLRRTAAGNELMRRFFTAGAFLLLLGLCFEPFEGGIKKDPSTYSYYFVTSGLAFFMLMGFGALQRAGVGKGLLTYLSLNGRNPMVAYVAGSLLLLPVLHLTGAIKLFDALNTSAWIGFLRGVLFTGIVSLITVAFTKRKWFWKT